MQKAFFNDRYQQTDAVIEGRKTMARQIMAGIDFPVNMVMGRVLPDKDGKIYAVANGENIIVKLRYKVGEVVAVAQSYEQIGANPQHYISRPDIDGYQIISMCPGWRNKMFVRAELMPHQICITGIKSERLQSISHDDAMREGIYMDGGDDSYMPHYFYDYPNNPSEGFDTPREAFAALVDKVYGRGTWDRNPWVVVYEFELVK